MPLDFVFQRVLQVAERIQILHFGFGAEFLRAAPAHADVGIAAQRAFFHVAVARLRCTASLASAHSDTRRLRWASACPARKQFPPAACRRGCNPRSFFPSESGNPSCRFFAASSSRCRRVMPMRLIWPSCSISKPPFGRQRQFVHGNLIALWQVGIKIIFAREARTFLHLADATPARRECPVPRRACSTRAARPASPGTPGRYWNSADRQIASSRRRTPWSRLQLHMDFEPDDRLVPRHDFGRDACEAVR